MVKKKATKSKSKSTSKSKTKTRAKKRAAPARKKNASSKAISNKNDEKYKAQYTTRHGSHLTKTTVGVSDTEADIKEEVE
jgi:HJR/Mrr/RecB family endonuclease